MLNIFMTWDGNSVVQASAILLQVKPRANPSRAGRAWGKKSALGFCNPQQLHGLRTVQIIVYACVCLGGFVGFSRLISFACVCVCMLVMPVCPDVASCGSGVLDKHVLDSSRVTSVSSALDRGFGLSLSSLITDAEIHFPHTQERSMFSDY